MGKLRFVPLAPQQSFVTLAITPSARSLAASRDSTSDLTDSCAQMRHIEIQTRRGTQLHIPIEMSPYLLATLIRELEKDGAYVGA